MPKKVTKRWLDYHGACRDMTTEEKKCNGDINLIIKSLIKNKHWSDANWLITHYMNKRQKVQYAVFAAEQVLHIFEDKHPDDDRPRKAIEAAKNYIKNPTRKNKAAAAATTAADAAAYAATAAAAATAADAAAYAAYAATAYATATAYADDAATAAAAADAAADAATAARNKMLIKILKNGLVIIGKLK